MGICNVVGSTIARETLCGMYTHAGPEVGVASTKAFTAQVIMLYMLALALSRGRTLSQDEITINLRELSRLPEKASRILELDSQIKDIAERFKDARNALYLGRGYNFPVALEGALKLKEISYIHAEGYPAAEMKHGPIALIDRDMPVIFIATRDSTYAKILSNIEEVRSRKGRVIAIANEGDQEVSRLAEHVIYIPQSSGPITPLLTVIPLQLLAYHIATLRGCNVDRPRNLAKPVPAIVVLITPPAPSLLSERAPPRIFNVFVPSLNEWASTAPVIVALTPAVLPPSTLTSLSINAPLPTAPAQ